MAAPDPATLLTAESLGLNSSTLAWEDGDGTETVEIYRGTDATFGSASVVSEVAAGVQEYEDMELDAATTYYYWVVCKNLDGDSAETGPAEIKTYSEDLLLTDIEQAIGDAITIIIGDSLGATEENIKVVLAQSGSVELEKPYCIYKLGAIVKNGMDCQYEDGSQSGDRSLNCSVNIFADDSSAFQMAADLQTGFDRIDIIEFLGKKDISVARVSGVLDLSAAFDTGYEQRAQMDLTILKSVNKPALPDLQSVDSVDASFGLEDLQ